MANDVSEREGLALKIQSTIEFHFGLLCDLASSLSENGTVPPQIAQTLSRRIRKEGNDAIRVIKNHLEFVNVARNHKEETVNKERVIRKLPPDMKG